MDTEKLIGLIIAVVAVIGGLGIGALVLYLAIPAGNKEKLAQMEARNKERLLLIEKGMDPAILNKTRSHGPLLWGLLLTGVGFGLIIGYLVSRATSFDQHILMHSLGLLFGGVGLIIYYIYRRKSDAGPAA